MINYEETKSQPISRLMVWQAYWKVRKNKGSAGVDAMDWAYLDNNLKTELYKLWNRLTSGSYFPPPVKRVFIPKKGGGVRPLGVPTILDRIAQEVVRTHLERIVEPLFHNSSYGYRPGRSCHQAVQQACDNMWKHKFVIDLDIKGFFDNIDHELMMKAVEHHCTDKWVRMYVSRWLKSGIYQTDGTTTSTTQGTPQGGVVSPLLSNIFLHFVFDKWMEVHYPHISFVRYADDIVVHCISERQAIYILGIINSRMKHCKLELHPDKTRIINFGGSHKSQKRYPKCFDFLGFTIRPKPVKCKDGRVRAIPGIFASRKSKSSMMKKFRMMNIHKLRMPIERLASIINPVVSGLINYYCKFRKDGMIEVWHQLNARLIKWVKWEKGIRWKDAINFLRTKHKEYPALFAHWQLARP